MADFSLGGRTLVDRLASQLRTQILAGELSPGARLSQDHIAERFSVSRIPVREALRQLAAEGLVTLQSHKSAIVTRLTSSEVAELLSLTGTLEVLAASRGASRLSQDDLHRMRGLLDAMKSVDSDPSAWSMLNTQFHLVIVRASGWRRITKLVEESRDNVRRFLSGLEFHRANVALWHEQHVAIYEACAAGDVERVKSLQTDHWQQSSIIVSMMLDEEGILEGEEEQVLKGSGSR